MRSLQTTTSRWIAVVGMLMGAASCDSARFDHVELYEIQGSPGAEISSSIIVPQGGVILFEAFPRAEANSVEYVGLERFKLRPDDPNVAEAHRAILRDTWVVSGIAVGTTRLQVLVDNEVVDRIPVEIVEAAP